MLRSAAAPHPRKYPAITNQKHEPHDGQAVPAGQGTRRPPGDFLAALPQGARLFKG